VHGGQSSTTSSTSSSSSSHSVMLMLTVDFDSFDSVALVVFDSVILVVITGSSHSSSTTGVGGSSTTGVGGSSVFLVHVHGTMVRVGVGVVFSCFGWVILRLLVLGTVVGLLNPLVGLVLEIPFEHLHTRASVVTANTATKRAKQIATRILMC